MRPIAPKVKEMTGVKKGVEKVVAKKRGRPWGGVTGEVAKGPIAGGTPALGCLSRMHRR